MVEDIMSESLEETLRKRSFWRRRSFVEEASTRNGASGNRSNMQSIKDTARRRADQAMRVYTGALGELRDELQPSYFESWTPEQIKEFLVSLNVELRAATMLSKASLVAILEKMFKGAAPDELPQPPEPLPEDFKKRKEKAARLVQDWWFLKKSRQWTRATVFPRPDSDGHLEANPLPSPRGVMRAAARGRISENTPWVPPSIEVARRFHDAIHPRLPDGDKFNFLKAKTGRFCFLGGCGEQLDLWDEGMISHFALYGAGVTSYFKFLKYCCWSFFVVSCAVLVHLFVNVNGGSITTVSNTNRISWTTIGNLGNSINVTEVVLPFCDAEQYSTCIVDKENLGMYYGYIDAGIVILFLAGYFWVNGFITDEFITIKRNTVTAAGAC